MDPSLIDLCLIFDPAAAPGKSPETLVENALRGGVKMIQYRDKSETGRNAYDSAKVLLGLTRRYGGVFIINDFVDLALSLDADGVHLGQEDLPIRTARAMLGPDRIIGASAHTVEQAVRAEKEGADYLGVGPVFMSTTKQVRPPIGLNRLSEIRRSVRIPILAIGGIDAGNVRSVRNAGADGAACISAILGRPDVSNAVREILEAMGSSRSA